MKIVDIREAKTRLSKLADGVIDGEPFIIAKAGKPLVRVEALETAKEKTRSGFLQGRFEVPDDFDRMGQSEVETLFGVDP